MHFSIEGREFAIEKRLVRLSFSSSLNEPQFVIRPSEMYLWTRSSRCILEVIRIPIVLIRTDLLRRRSALCEWSCLCNYLCC